jgi:putative oxidoreductase
MPAPPALRRPAELGLRVAAALSFAAPLLTRIPLGLAFVGTGRGKWQHIDNVVGFFTDLGIPFASANAHFVASLELVGGACLVVGLLTRLMAAGLASTMVVALMTADRANFVSSWSPAAENGPLDVVPFVYLCLLAWLVLLGPGVVSLDGLLRRWLGLPPSSAGAPPR